MNHYEQRRQARIERYRERAANAREEATRQSQESRAMLAVIPFGQPILVGHHSEGRDRRYRDRAWNNMDRAMEASEKAEHYDRRAEAAASNRMISSDDPEAVTKLKAKIAKAEANQVAFRAANRIIRRKPKNEPTPEKLAELAELIHSTAPKLDTDGGYTVAANLFEPDFAGRVGFPSYVLTNNNANIRRMKDRLVSLEHEAEAERKETEHAGFTVVENPEENRVQIVFPGKPPATVRTVLKSHGFRWSRYNLAWQRHLNNAGRWAAQEVVREIS